MYTQISEHASTTDHARFLSSHNPAQVKRNVLASFTDVLLLPVTIVPKTVGMTVGAVGAAAGAAGTAAVQGLQMLNPQRWAGSNTTLDGYSQRFDGGDTLFEIGVEDDEDDEPAPIPTRLVPSKIQETPSEQRTESTVSPPSLFLTDNPS
jgi:recyclin-1